MAKAGKNDSISVASPLFAKPECLLFAKSECQDEWQEGCKIASKLGGLPEEEAGKKWFSGELEKEYWDRAAKQRQAMFRQGNYFNSINRRTQSEDRSRFKKLMVLSGKILRRIKDALDRRAWLLKGYTANDLEEWAVPASLVTFEALVHWAGSDHIMLSNGIKVFCLRLVREVVSDSASHNEGAASANVRQGRRRQAWQKDRIIRAVGELEEEGVLVKKLTRPELRRLIQQKLPGKPNGLQCPGRTTLDVALEELGLGK
jgi:hypothetical protein